jgi:hypothetical protein
MLIHGKKLAMIDEQKKVNLRIFLAKKKKKSIDQWRKKAIFNLY